MKREYLENMGITKENIDGIMSEYGKGITDIRNELDAANGTITTLKTAVSKFDGVDVEKLKGDISTWETKYNTDINNARLNAALDTALMVAKARDVKAVKPFIDMGMIKLDGDKVLGIEEQLKGIKESRGFLFEEDKATTVRTGMRQTGTEEITDKKEEANAAFRSLFGKGE